MSNLETQFQKIASEYISLERDEDRSHYEMFVNWPSMKAMLPEPPVRVLDYGCGGGFYSQMLAQKGHSVLAVDNAPQMVEYTRLKNIDAKVWSYNDKPMNEHFDVIVVKLVLQFVDNLPRFAEVMQAHLGNRGWVVVSVPHPDQTREKLHKQQKSSIFESEIGDSSMFVQMIHREKQEYVSAFDKAGLKLESIDEPIDPLVSSSKPKRLNMLFRDSI